jgi:hypothetical protein
MSAYGGGYRDGDSVALMQKFARIFVADTNFAPHYLRQSGLQH